MTPNTTQHEIRLNWAEENVSANPYSSIRGCLRSHSELNSSQVKIKYEFSKPFRPKRSSKDGNHTESEQFLWPIMNNFSDSSTTYKLIIKQLFSRALCSYFNHRRLKFFAVTHNNPKNSEYLIAISYLHVRHLIYLFLIILGPTSSACVLNVLIFKTSPLCPSSLEHVTLEDRQFQLSLYNNTNPINSRVSYISSEQNR